MAIPAILLGMLAVVRILGSFAALITAATIMLQAYRRSWLPRLLYAGLAALVTLATGPYLFPNPLTRFSEVVRPVADNPQLVPALFVGRVYSSADLPASYLARLPGMTLNGPVWLLASVGLLGGQAGAGPVTTALLCLPIIAAPGAKALSGTGRATRDRPGRRSAMGLHAQESRDYRPNQASAAAAQRPKGS